MTNTHSGKIGVIHLSLNPCGGAERLALTFSAALRKAGYEVDLITTERPDWRLIQRRSDYAQQIFDREIVIPPFTQLPGIYSTFLEWLCRDALATPFLRRGYDLTITTTQTLPFVFSDILYIHFLFPVIPSHDLVHWRRYSTGMMRAYSFPYKLLIGIFLDLFKSLIQKPILITNSKFTRQVIGEYLQTAPLVVYPPVETKKYMPSSHTSKKGNIVVTISRLEEIKNLTLIPKLARETRNAKFIILGNTAAASKKYVSHLLYEARAFGVEDKIEVIRNVSETSKKEILSQAKIYLHTMLDEPFGISIVEAMAAGLVPVVHKSGGPWTDILGESQGAHGYSYTSVDEAAHIIDELFEKEQERQRVSVRAIERSKLFDSERFEQSMLRIVRDRLAASF